MRVFSNPKGDEFKSLITEYETYLPQYFGKLGEAYNDYPIAKDNPEYLIYVNYNKWPIRKLEYSFVISEMKKAIFQGAKVLDAGCGVSSMPFLWANLGGDVTAVDFDKKNIDLMNQFNDDDYFQIHKKVNLNVCDIMQLPYSDHTFDIVTTTSVLEHLPYPNYILAIGELYRVLKPGGILICTCDIKAESDSKRNAIGAFSTDDIINILSNFKDELIGESRVFDNLKITENVIEEFWSSHYYDGIGYTGNRQYVAIGFSLIRKDTEDKKKKLISYNNAIHELIEYQNRVQKLLDEIQIKKELIIEIEEDSNQRLKDNEKLILIVKELEKACQERLNNINVLTEIIKQKDNVILPIEDEIQKNNKYILECKDENRILIENNHLLEEKYKNSNTKLNIILENKVIKFLRKIKILK
jgi:ubiquinone/menaquinone biosynthesis C-methylase UbiE